MENSNISFDKDSLLILNEAIKNNTATSEDYEKLNGFLSSMGAKDYLINEFKKYNIWNFEMFIENRKRPKEYKDLNQEAVLIGVLDGVIEFLKRGI